MEKRTEIVLGVCLLVAMVITAGVLIAIISHSKNPMSEDELREFLTNEFETAASKMCTKVYHAMWAHYTDLNNKDKNRAYVKAQEEEAILMHNFYEKYFKNLNPDDYKDERIKRQVMYGKQNGKENPDDGNELGRTIDEMIAIYSKAKFCPHNKTNCDLSKEGLSVGTALDALLLTINDSDTLTYYWAAYRNASGAKIKDHYKAFVKLTRQRRKFTTEAEYWSDDYESPTFAQNRDDLWTQLQPLFLELHKYTRKKVKEHFGDEYDCSDGLIPEHLFGLQSTLWSKILGVLMPYPNATKFDRDKGLNSGLKENSYSILDMFKTSDEFYQSLGLLNNSMCYDKSKGAMIEKPTDGREVVCHASAWDFCDGKDFRIKMCAKVDFDNFLIIHHEMGHIQYQQQYAKQPYLLREGANPGFHEAVGDTMALSVGSTVHLQKINQFKNYEDNDETSINLLMKLALQKVSKLPFSMLVEKWKWDVFKGNVKEDQWNAHWWEMKKKYLRTKPPLRRSDETDFDPGSYFHVATNVDLTRYFISYILQFQFLKSLCLKAKQYEPGNKAMPLYKCDFYKSKAAGKMISDGLSLGRSKHWKDVLDLMTGEREMNASALLEYFEPLYDFMKEKNKV